MLIKITSILITIFFCSVLQAQTVLYNQEFQINTYTSSFQGSSTVCGLSDGGFVVCWVSGEQDGYWGGVFGQVYDSIGTKRGPEFQVNTYIYDTQTLPRVCGLSDSGFAVCWQSYGQDGDVWGIFGQMFDRSGIKRGQEFQINTYIPSFQIDPNVCGLSDGGFVVCWQSVFQNGEVDGVFGQMYDRSGTKRGSEFQVNTDTTIFQTKPTICNLSDGGFVVCWKISIPWGEPLGLFGQKYDSEGIKRGEIFEIYAYTDGTLYGPSVCRLSNGGFVVCWSSGGPLGTSYDIFGQIYESNDTKRGEEFLVNTYLDNQQFFPDICGLSNGGFVICWQSRLQDGNGHGIFAQLYDSSGTKRGVEFQVNTYIDDDQRDPDIFGLSDGGFVICWSSRGQDGSEYGVYGKYYLGSPVLHLLKYFNLKYPVNDTTLTPTANFQWQNASSIHINFPWELEYSLYLDKTESFDDPQIFSNIYDTTFSVEELNDEQTYFWKVLAKNIDGDSLWSSETFGFYVSLAADIDNGVEIKPGTFILYDNYPNPFNPETTIRYSLPADQSTYRVIVKIYDVLGQLVITLRDAQQRPGFYYLTWDGRNAAGQAVPSGVYFLTLEAGNFKATQKMLLVR